MKQIMLSILLLPFLLFSDERSDVLHTLAQEWISRSLYATTKLGVPDALEEEAMSAEQLAGKLECHAPSLERSMIMLVEHGFYKKKGHLFANNKRSRLLAEASPSSLKALVEFYGEEIRNGFSELGSSIKEGKPAFQILYKDPVFSYFRKHPERAALFNRAMVDKSRAVVQACLAAYDFSGMHRIYDIGSGKGYFSFALLDQYPSMKAFAFDLPELFEQDPPEGRLKYIGGNFFESVPVGGDGYILKSVIHDWNDDEAATILKNCAEAMGPQAKLILIEPILMEDGSNPYAWAMDILMMTITGGKARTLGEFQTLLKRGGFEIKKVIPTSTEFSIIEASLAKKPLSR